MKETYYKSSGKHLLKGISQLGISMWHTVENYPAWFLLSLSIVGNMVMFYNLADARIERDASNAAAYSAAQKVDSLSLMVPHWVKAYKKK